MNEEERDYVRGLGSTLLGAGSSLGFVLGVTWGGHLFLTSVVGEVWSYVAGMVCGVVALGALMICLARSK